MPNPGSNKILFLGCQHLKIQDILPFTYTQPPLVGQLCACLSPDPVLEFVARTRFHARRDPRPRLRSLLRAHPTHTNRLWLLRERCWDRFSKTGQQVGGARRYLIALRRIQALGKYDPLPSHSSDFMKLLSQQLPSSSEAGEREPAANAYNRLLHHVLSR